jgi:hypothetical protein
MVELSRPQQTWECSPSSCSRHGEVQQACFVGPNWAVKNLLKSARQADQLQATWTSEWLGFMAKHEQVDTSHRFATVNLEGLADKRGMTHFFNLDA